MQIQIHSNSIGCPKTASPSVPVLYWLSHLTCISSLKAKNERKTWIFTQLKISRYKQHFFAILRRILINWPPTYLLQSDHTFDWGKCWEETDFFLDRTHPFVTDIRCWINFWEIQSQTRRHRDHNYQHWEGYCEQQSNRFLKLIPLLQVLVARRYFANSGSFRDVCGELIGVVQDRPVQGPPFISNRLWGTSRISIIIQEKKIAEKKSKSMKSSVQQTTDG